MRSTAATSRSFDDLASVEIVAVIPARMTSFRLPGKGMADLAGQPVLAQVIDRVRCAQTVGRLCLATTTNQADDPLVVLARELGIDVFRGDEDDVLGRFVGAAEAMHADVVVRANGDSPLIDAGVLDACVLAYFGRDVHLCANNLNGTFPIGLDVQVVSTDVLRDVAARTDDPEDREHVTLHVYVHRDRYDVLDIEAVGLLRRPAFRLTLDTEDDLAFMRAVVAAVGPLAPAADIVRLLDDHPEVVDLNRHVQQHHPRDSN
jgi:spore coat polysaccharide biosynthesis protein SpsF